MDSRKFRKSQTVGILLNLLMPGLGHCYWREYIFGLFVFLVMLIGAALFLVSFFVDLPGSVKWLLLALPAVFYLFTFLDLYRIAANRKAEAIRGVRGLSLFFLIGLAYFGLSPVAVGNFGLLNRPEVFTMKDNSFNPIHRKGDLLKTDRLAYTVRIFGFSGPIMHALPGRYDIVSYNDVAGNNRVGTVIGLPGENVEVLDGIVIVNGLPDYERNPSNLIQRGEWPLTPADDFSILVATMSMGAVGGLQPVSLDNINGKVSKVF